MTDLQIFVVSLAEDNPRRPGFARLLQDLRLSAEFFDAVDGRNGIPTTYEPEFDRAAALVNTRRTMSDAEFACALSHRLVCQQFLQTTAEWALVLEDDAILDDRLVRFLGSGGYRAAPMILLHHINARVLGTGRPVPECDSLLYALATPPFRATAYTVNRRAAQGLIDAQMPVQNIADWPMDISDIKACALVPEIVGHPALADVPSMIEPGRQTKRQRRAADFLSPRYLRRKWRKARSRKVS